MKQIEEYEVKKRQQIGRARSVVDYTMGLLFIAFGVYELFFDKRQWELFKLPEHTGNYILGALFLIYGAWRMRRGYKKNYFKD
jgi:threonine/homoserine/homoserine lactone efflux protein